MRSASSIVKKLRYSVSASIRMCLCLGKEKLLPMAVCLYAYLSALRMCPRASVWACPFFFPSTCMLHCLFVCPSARACLSRSAPFYDVINYHLHWRAMVDLRRHLDHLLPMQHMVTWIQLSRISYIQDHRRLVVYEQSIPLLTINHSALITLVSVKSR